MLTKAELDFYERVPSILRDLTNEINGLSKEVDNLRCEVKELREDLARR